MSKKLTEGFGEPDRVQFYAPHGWLARVHAWRARQAVPPSLSEALRTLVDAAIEAERANQSRKR